MFLIAIVIHPRATDIISKTSVGIEPQKCWNSSHVDSSQDAYLQASSPCPAVSLVLYRVHAVQHKTDPETNRVQSSFRKRLQHQCHTLHCTPCIQCGPARQHPYGTAKARTDARTAFSRRCSWGVALPQEEPTTHTCTSAAPMPHSPLHAVHPARACAAAPIRYSKSQDGRTHRIQ